MKTSREDEKPLDINPNIQVPERLAGDKGTKENTSGIEMLVSGHT